MRRAAGVLLPMTSLPSPYGVGCFSQQAYDFVDWLKKAGQTFWQILPISPTSMGDSPYQGFSTYAGNPYMISLDALVEEKLLTRLECDEADFGDNEASVAYDKLYQERYKLLRKAYERAGVGRDEAYQQFVQENDWWLKDYALFMAVKNFFGGKSWAEWPEDIRLRWGFALDYYREKLYFDIEFQCWMQYKFFQQYRALKKYANENGIRIVGDIPIYVAMDSADVWAHPELFQLDEKNVPLAVAGCPPDGFSATGQLWGNPLYKWDYHKQTGFQWWCSRIWWCYQLYDVTRIDHFRGFDEYYAIPYGAETAALGHWEKGPGMDLFRALEKHLGVHEVIAEDLGYMTDSVRQLVKDSGFANMKVLEFAFDARDTGAASDYLPHNYPVNCVAYTGTHDNETLVGWFQVIAGEERDMARDYFCDHYTPDEEMYKVFIGAAMRSVAKWCIIPMQDYLGLDNSCRLNTPATSGVNWRWRVTQSQLTDELQTFIADVTRRYGRFNYPAEEAKAVTAEEEATHEGL